MEVRVRFEDGIWYGGTLRRNHRIGPLTRIDYDDGTSDYIDVQAELEFGSMKDKKEMRRVAPPAAVAQPAPKAAPPKPAPPPPARKPPRRSLVESCGRKRAHPYTPVGMLKTVSHPRACNTKAKHAKLLPTRNGQRATRLVQASKRSQRSAGAGAALHCHTVQTMG